MWCSTECWDCEDKNCEHYIHKSALYFENKSLKVKIDKAINTIEKHLYDKKFLNDIYSDKQMFNMILDILKGE